MFALIQVTRDNTLIKFSSNLEKLTLLYLKTAAELVADPDVSEHSYLTNVCLVELVDNGQLELGRSITGINGVEILREWDCTNKLDY